MSEQTNRKVPQIRFKGFEGEWEKKKLADLIDLGSGRDYKHLSPGDIPVYGTGGYMLSVNEALSSSIDAVGIGRKGTIDKPYILRAPFWTVDTLFYAIPKAENILDFVYCIFQRIDWKQRDESTGVPSLSKVAINEVSVLSTKPAEQTKIGKYFRALDSLIGLHQRKHDKLVTLKKAMLQKMFPQPGATTPEIRFKGFEGEWKEKPLGELANIYQPQTISQRDLTATGFNVYGANGIIGKYSRYNHEEPQIAVTCRGNTCGTVNFTEAKSWITGNAMVVNVDDNKLIFKPFLFQQLSSQDLNYLITGSGQPQITGIIKSHKTWICHHSEQQKIGTYFRTLDALISKHATQLQKLQQIKSACLAKMFV